MRVLSKYLAATTLTTGLLVGGYALLPGDASALAKPPVEKHPHIHRALRDLRHARQQLTEAIHDYDGHRAEALADVDRAIKQCEVCLKTGH